MRRLFLLTACSRSVGREQRQKQVYAGAAVRTAYNIHGVRRTIYQADSPADITKSNAAGSIGFGGRVHLFLKVLQLFAGHTLAVIFNGDKQMVFFFRMQSDG